MLCTAKKRLLAIPGGQKVGPYVEGLIGQLKEAQDAVSGWAAWVSVARDDAVFMENLEKENSWFIPQLLWQLCKAFFLYYFEQQYTKSEKKKCCMFNKKTWIIV